MQIRMEESKDFDAVYSLVYTAFKGAEHKDGTEQDLVVKLRKSTSFIPELSLVAEENGEVIGHIMFTKAMLSDDVVLALAPLSVHPSHQKQGVGKALIERGHEIAKTLGYDYSVVLGSEKYYPKFGYVEASTYGILAPFDVPSANFMAKKLSNTDKFFSDTLQYAKAFFE